ncbi:phospholipase D-like domain-containing protein [Sediminibacterium ginsengisoli]|uniref:Putative cardiolipin synthase n=1 Tax=Sediminibacterium ginsengisoli TaxID=413434 RepID=A0A1T4PAV3_9BACT|nr:phospholipase D-like domain-containing protein [Sediminibacterium ginsengisoli]SJZ88609.1 putative cardiolipin synthase [Sediminibacterium ginsengisoli]
MPLQKMRRTMGSRRKKTRQFSIANKTKLIRGGADYFDLLRRMISGASHTIHFQTYIFDADETGRAIADALKEAAARKVCVFLLVDGYASQSLPKDFLQELEDAGIHFRFFQPFFKSREFYFGRRLHHKVVAIDNSCALVGGVNVSNKYNDINGKPAWLDFAVHVEGPAAQELFSICLRTWKGIAPLPGNFRPVSPPPAYDPSFGHSAVRISRNDWLRHRNQVSKTYGEIFTTSSNEITILCSYFIPGAKMKKYIERAVKRGVKVRVIMAGMSDVKLSKNAERFMYDWLLRNNVDIYEYTRNILHGKLAICDKEWLTVGSYNINDLSAYGSIELNLDIRDKMLAKRASGMIDEIIKADCEHITREQVEKARSPLRQFVLWLSYQLVRLMFRLVTFDHK